MSACTVVIIGGGPVGLTAAHCLSKAGVGFVVLERRSSIIEDVGASLVISPQSLRVMGQLGFLDRFRTIGQEVLRIADFTTEGKKYKEGWHTIVLKECNGAYSQVFHRAEVIRALYESLSITAQSKILTGKDVVGIDHDGDGVSVRCADGTRYNGSLVIGADGVHSTTRRIMQHISPHQTLESGLKSDRGAFDRPFPTEYRTMWCALPRLWEHAPGDMLVTHGWQASLQFLNGQERSWLFLYERIKDPDSKGRVKYTEKDIEAFVKEYATMPIGEHLQLKDVFAKRQTCGMSNLEEGILPQWSSGRIVLAGDACHKVTPNAGLGFNSGVQDVVAITNELYRCLRTSSHGFSPNEDMLRDVFRKYHASRISVVESDLNASAKLTRMSAWPNKAFWLLDQYVLTNIPSFDRLWFRYFIAPKVSRGLVLDFLGGQEPFVGKLPWVNPITQDTKAGR